MIDDINCHATPAFIESINFSFFMAFIKMENLTEELIEVPHQLLARC